MPAPQTTAIFGITPEQFQQWHVQQMETWHGLETQANNIIQKSKPVVPEQNTKKLLQEIISFRPLKLSKAQSIAYEKLIKISGVPYEFADKRGLFGIEVEVENIRSGVPIECYWSYKQDGSLRNNGAEFVSIPLRVNQIQLALEHLYTALTTNNAPDFSPRTSIHVHVNCRDMTQDQIYNLVLLYSIFEKHFYSVAGTRRLNSIFCVPLFRSNQLQNLKAVVYGLASSWSKYNGLNLLPLFNGDNGGAYGTIEFRHLHGTNNIHEILDWINDIICLRKFACEADTEWLLTNIQEMNTTSGYLSLYHSVFDRGRKILHKKHDFEECVSNIKRDLWGDTYTNTIKRTEGSLFWTVCNEFGVKG